MGIINGCVVRSISLKGNTAGEIVNPIPACRQATRVIVSPEDTLVRTFRHMPVYIDEVPRYRALRRCPSDFLKKRNLTLLSIPRQRCRLQVSHTSFKVPEQYC